MNRVGRLMIGVLVITASCGSTSGADSTPQPSLPPVPRNVLLESGTEPHPGFPPGNTIIAKQRGPGWRVISHQRLGHPYTAFFVATEKGLSRWADVSGLTVDFEPPAFGTEILVSLTVAVSGSCPDLVFTGLTITDSQVFGSYEFPSPDGEDTGCTSDANPVTFVLAVGRSALPDTFSLGVFEHTICGGCDSETIAVDLNDENALEAAQFGASRLAMYASGPPPGSGFAYVMQWDIDYPNGLIQSAATWKDPFAVGWYEEAPSLTLTGFVTECSDCAVECVMAECAGLVRVGDECTLHFVPRPFEDSTATFAFDGETCTVSLMPGYTVEQ